MTEALQMICARFVQSLGRSAIAEYFSDEDVWATVQELADMAGRGQNMGPGPVSALRNLGAAIGVKPGAPPIRYMSALERYFGPCPLKPGDIERVFQYVHSHMNGRFAVTPDEKVSLTPANPVGHVPLKNYEYK